MRTLALLPVACGLAGVAIWAAPAAGQRAHSKAVVASDLITGEVVASHAEWTSGASRIVTRSVIRSTDGTEHRVHQLGGTIHGVGMRVIPGTPLLRQGQQVQVTTNLQATGPSRAVVEVLSATGPGNAIFSVRTLNDAGAPLYWKSGCVFIAYDSAGTAHLPGDDEFTVMDGVFNHWQTQLDTCSYMSFSMEPRTDIEVGLDGVNLVKFREVDWCPPDAQSPADCYSPGAAGLTTLFFIDDAGSSRNGEILDADIELNAVNFAVSSNGSSEGGQECLSDLANTLTHEVGHLLGLDHTCWTPVSADEIQPVDHTGALVPRCFPSANLPADVTEATMYNFQECGETKKASLHEDDVEFGACLIYPLADDPAECKGPNISGDNCAASGSRGSAVVLLLLGLLIATTRRRR